MLNKLLIHRESIACQQWFSHVTCTAFGNESDGKEQTLYSYLYHAPFVENARDNAFCEWLASRFKNMHETILLQTDFRLYVLAAFVIGSENGKLS
jgi:hypothetical protein